VFKAPEFPPEFNLADYFLFDRLEEGLGGKAALLFGDLRYTYAEVAERARSLRAFFASIGLGREERVLLLLHDTPAFAYAFFATLHHGAVVAMGNPDAPSIDLAYLIEYTRAAVVFTNPRTAEGILPALGAARLRALVLVPEVATGGDVEGDLWPMEPGLSAHTRGEASVASGASAPPKPAGDSWEPRTSFIDSEPFAAEGATSGVSSVPDLSVDSPAPSGPVPVYAPHGGVARELPIAPDGAPEDDDDDTRITLPPPAIRGEPPASPAGVPWETPQSSPGAPGPLSSAVHSLVDPGSYASPLRALGALSPVSLRDALEYGRASLRHLAPPRPTRRDDIAIWLFTSGSTGKSKAAIHAHRDFAFSTECYAKGVVGYRRDDITVSVSRLFFGYATGTNLMFPFAVGGAVGLFAERPTPEALVAAIERYRPTVVTNVPTMMSKLLEFDEARATAGEARLDLSSVRFHLSAGEALPPGLFARFTARFKSDVYDGIGSAEMFHIYCTNRPGDIMPGSLGRVVPGYTLKILRAEAEGPGESPLPPGETGVMWVKGDSVAMGYFQDRDKSWATFFGHWCRTGDLFRLDEEGYLWFSGRADDLLKVGGVWVSPVEVEDCLTLHPKVALAAVIGGEEEGLTKPKAFIVPREEARGALGTAEGRRAFAEELKAHVKARLTRHKYPRWVVFVEDVPKNDRGKIDRKVLKEQEAQGKNPVGD
jgi:acyl-coenzyme A synthetase/AMP-(fatty) acid ligase